MRVPLLVALLSTALCLPALAQDDDLLGAVRDLLGEDAKTRPDIQQVNAQLATCRAQVAPQDASASAITFAVDIGPDGLPVRPADMIAPTASDASQADIQQLLWAEAAVIACVPLTVDGNAARNIRLVVTADQTDLKIARVEPLPAPLTAPALASDEIALALPRDSRREVQVRLGLAGFQPGGADGVFGPRTRAAIEQFQLSKLWPVTGYLNAFQVETLKSDTATAYASYLASRPAAGTSAPGATRGRYYRGADGCLRYRNGKIVPKQSFRCDARGLIDF